ncbi:hypothetical protein SDC9_201467 [bioreactor metagenome]|uniref:Uncharacterized protein n=1 Tax=bioreactor metagenome TaxID=1076179 RepID=A0A645IR13_9ZZZZ
MRGPDRRVVGNFDQIFPCDFFIDKHADNDGVDSRNTGGLSRCANASVDAANDHNGDTQSEQCLLESGP